ncbi:MAG: hypothetical protein QOD77_252 [Thermoplasmata archaeon]|jgi:hypothetical protein|nr:hypothetical protein [Thermoplasmata archaeon]
MRTQTLILTGLLAMTSVLAIVPHPAAAAIQPPCPHLDCVDPDPIQVCQDLDIPADPTSEPTSVSCFGSPCGCNCPVVGAAFVLEADGQRAEGLVAATCGGGFRATLTPGPADASAPVLACVTPIVYPLVLAPGSLCSSVDPETSCINLWTEQAVLTPVCPSECQYSDLGLDGVIGDVVRFVESVAAIGCEAAFAEAGLAGAAATATEAYAGSQAQAVLDAVPCTRGCHFTVPWLNAYVSAVEATAVAQAGGQASLACSFLTGDPTCNGSVAEGAPAGVCPAPIPRGLGGVVGAALDYTGAACDAAAAGAAAAVAATGTFAGAATAAVVGLVEAEAAYATAFAAARVADASAYGGQVAGIAGAAVATGATAVAAACGVTAAFLLGGSCPA